MNSTFFNVKFNTMKRFFLSFSLMVLVAVAMAQPGGHHPHGQPPHAPNPKTPPVSHAVTFTAAHGELFHVYVDGDIVNKRAMSSVLVRDLSPQYHDVYVVLKTPADKIVMVPIMPSMATDNYIVSYSASRRILEVKSTQPQPHVQPVPAPNAPRLCTFEEVEKMYQTLKNESFDDDRLKLAKFMVSNNLLASHQVKRLAESFAFDSGKVKFLKYAYDFCADPQNYYECLEVLTFSNDKEQVLKYIQSK